MSHYSYPNNLISSQKCAYQYKYHNLLSTIAVILNAYDSDIDKDAILPKILAARGIIVPTIADIHNPRVDKLGLARGFIHNMMRSFKISISDLAELQCDVFDILNINQFVEVKPNSWNLRHYFFSKSSQLAESSIETIMNFHNLRCEVAELYHNYDLADIIFSPVSQLSVGHLIYPLHACLYSIYNSIAQGQLLPVKGYVSDYGYGHDFLHLLLRKFPNILELYRIPIEARVHELVSSISSDTVILRMPIERQIKYEEFLSSRFSISSSNVNFNHSPVLHLRTSQYKQDHSRQNDLRNTDVSLVRDAIIDSDIFAQPVTLISSDSFSTKVMSGLNNIHVVDRESSRKQWKAITKTNIFIGCLSGISHLDSLFSGYMLYLNVHSFIVEFPIKNQHIFALRKVTAKKNLLWIKRNVPKDILAYGLIYGFDRAFTAFAEFVDLKHLSKYEMIEDFHFFKKMCYGGSSVSNPYSLQSLLSQLGLSHIRVPKRYMSKRAFEQYLAFFNSIYSDNPLILFC